MGKCVRIRGSIKPPPPPAAAAASCLTLRSGRRVLPAAGGPPRATRRHRGPSSRPSALRWCGAADKQRASCGSPRRRSKADDAGSPQHKQLRLRDDGGRPEEEESPSQAAGTGAAVPVPLPRGLVDDGRGDDSFGAIINQLSRRCRGVVAGQTPSRPTEAEIEAFFAAAELAERRRFAEAYNYDVALDRPLEGRFEWAPLST